MKKLIKLCSIFIMYSYNVQSQNSINTIFKTLLVLDGSINSGKKSDFLLSDVNLKIECDELISKRIDTILYPYYFKDYKIYSFTVGKNKVITDEASILISSNLCKTYILIFNVKNQKYYRIKGFNGNDFNHLLADIIISKRIKIKEKQIVKDLDNLKIEGLDFKCLYEAIIDLPSNRLAYPCMMICTEGKPMHKNN